jgi:hypothetical protein
MEKSKRQALLDMKPSELLTAALDDLEKIEAQPDVYKIDMNQWHEPENGCCHICLAGAFLTGHLEVSPLESLYPSRLEAMERGLGIRMIALDDLRLGNVRSGVSRIHGFGETGAIVGLPLSVHVPRYQDNPKGFKDSLRAVASQLGELGI